ncbi:extracellular solute-binding protein [Microbacterium gilvum]|uniref:Extracellular solute-binding protein n=1 Tax=Microbacterium gilvum TaxID=1336204 RepID=A0ABP9APU7_9MICO
MSRRFLSVAALASVGALALTSCSAASDGSDSGSADLDTLSIMAPYFSTTAPEDDDAVGEALAELTGVDLDMRWVPNADYGTQTNVVLAGDDIPDVMVIQNKDQGFIQTAQAGGFWDLTDHLASGDYPNLVSENPAVQEAASINGTVYGVYRARDVIRQSVILRADWLENLGLDLPETTDDLREIARAFTEDDPDGNGQDDTTGLIEINWPSVGTGSFYDAIDVWFGSGNVWRDDDGTLTPAWLTDEWRESLEYQKEFVDSGWVNADFATKEGTTWNQSFMNGEGGIIIDVQSRAAEIVNLLRDTDPEGFDSYVALAGQLEGPDGTYALPTAGYSGFLAIPKARVQTEEQLKAVLEVLDALNTEDGQRLLNNGIEGENYVEEDGFAVYDDAQAEQTALVTGAWAQLGMAVGGYEGLTAKPATDYDAELAQRRLDLQAEDVENAVYNPAAGLLSETYVTSQTQLDQIIADARVQYLAGELDDAGLEAALERWRASGGDQVTAELQELYDAQ